MRRATLSTAFTALLLATSAHSAGAEGRDLLGITLPESSVQDKSAKTIARCAGVFAYMFLKRADPGDAKRSTLLLQRAMGAADKLPIEELMRERADAIEREQAGMAALTAAMMERTNELSSTPDPLALKDAITMIVNNSQAVDCAEFGAMAQDDEFWKQP